MAGSMILIGNPMASIDRQKSEEASLACHEWQHGSHIDSLPKQQAREDAMSVIDRVSLADQIAEVKREIEMRKRVYIRQVDQQKLTPEEAERRMLAMCGVLHTLERVRDMGGLGTINNNGEEHHDDDDARRRESIKEDIRV